MKNTIVKLLITLIIFVAFVWSSSTTITSSTVLIKEVRPNEIVIETSNKESETIKIHSTLQNVIYEDKDYFIKYTKKRFGKPKLNHIEPI